MESVAAGVLRLGERRAFDASEGFIEGDGFSSLVSRVANGPRSGPSPISKGSDCALKQDPFIKWSGPRPGPGPVIRPIEAFS